MSFFAKPPTHRAYVLRIWEERTNQPKRPPEWRFSLEDAETGKRHGFAEIRTLVGFLESELAHSSTQPVTEPTEHNPLSRWVQSVKDTFRPLSDSELNIAAAGSEQPDQADGQSPDEDQPATP